jgi:hypothetical protein
MAAASSFRRASELGEGPWKGVVKPLVLTTCNWEKQKKKKRSPSLACNGSTKNYPLTVFDLSHIINNPICSLGSLFCRATQCMWGM